MATIVIVHGGFGGGWEWTPVARLLRERGHDALTPTLTGMGERAHLGRGEAIGLSTHVEDLVAVLEFEDLRDVVLCGASYGGMAVTGAADRVPDRIALVVYVDALVPRDGQSGLDLLPPAFAAKVRAGVAEHGEAWRVPIPASILPPKGSMPEQERAGVIARVRDQPAASFTEPIRLTGALDLLPRAFIRCTTYEFGADIGGDPIEPCAARARSEGWVYRELAAPHDPHLFDRVATATALHELATSATSGA